MNPEAELSLEEEVYLEIKKGKWPLAFQHARESKFDGNKSLAAFKNDNIVWLCAIKNKHQLLRVMFQRGNAKPTTTEFNYAIKNRHYQSALAFIEAGADVNAVPSKDLTPLLHAVAAGSLSIFQLLLEHGAKLELCDFHGRNVMDIISRDAMHFPLEKACLFDMIVKRGVKPTEKQCTYILRQDSGEQYGSKYLVAAVQAYQDGEE